jgi:hypothetical protein
LQEPGPPGDTGARRQKPEDRGQKTEPFPVIPAQAGIYELFPLTLRLAGTFDTALVQHPPTTILSSGF